MPLFKILIIISRNVGDKKVISMTCTLTAKARQKSISMTCTLDSQGQAPWGLGYIRAIHPLPNKQSYFPSLPERTPKTIQKAPIVNPNSPKWTLRPFPSFQVDT